MNCVQFRVEGQKHVYITDLEAESRKFALRDLEFVGLNEIVCNPLYIVIYVEGNKQRTVVIRYLTLLASRRGPHLVIERTLQTEPSRWARIDPLRVYHGSAGASSPWQIISLLRFVTFGRGNKAAHSFFVQLLKTKLT